MVVIKEDVMHRKFDDYLNEIMTEVEEKEEKVAAEKLEKVASENKLHTAIGSSLMKTAEYCKNLINDDEVTFEDMNVFWSTLK